MQRMGKYQNDATMTDTPSSETQRLPSAPSAVSIASTALVIGAGLAQMAAEVEESDSSPSGPTPNLSVSGARSRVRAGVTRQRRKPVRHPHPVARPKPFSVQAKLTEPVAGNDVGPADTRSELRDWIKDNATLLSNASLLISLAAVALSLLPDVRFFAPYIKALIFAGALLLLTELHHQWPEDLQLDMLRRNARPENHSWRMTGFAFVMQVATVMFAAWATLTNPIILLPLTAVVVVLAFRQWYFRRFEGLVSRSFGIIALVAVLLLTEVLMVVVWAAVTGEQVTLELWAEGRPGLRIEN